MSLMVTKSGVHSLLQDSGRRGYHRLGLTNGGALDGEAYHYLNRLLQNSSDATAIEVTVGGLALRARVDTYICVTGATVPLTINDEERALWCVHQVNAGDDIELGFATRAAAPTSAWQTDLGCPRNSTAQQRWYAKASVVSMALRWRMAMSSRAPRCAHAGDSSYPLHNNRAMPAN